MWEHLLNWLISPETIGGVIIFVGTLVKGLDWRNQNNQTQVRLDEAQIKAKNAEVFDHLIGIAIQEVKKNVALEISKADKNNNVIEFLKSKNKELGSFLNPSDLLHIADIAYNTYVKPSLGK